MSNKETVDSALPVATAKAAGQVRSPGGFPLAAIFLLIALVAILLAQLGLILTSESFDAEALVAAAIFGAVSGLIYGFFIGLYHYRIVRGGAVGAMTGLVAGALTSPICVAAVGDPWKALFSSIGGSVVLVVLAALYRILNRSDAALRADSISQLAKSSLTREENAGPWS